MADRSPTSDLMNCRLLIARPSEECGCPEEEWLVENLLLTVHFEPDGRGHIIIDGGDWEVESEVDAADMASLRQHAFGIIERMPRE